MTDSYSEDILIMYSLYSSYSTQKVDPFKKPPVDMGPVFYIPPTAKNYKGLKKFQRKANFK